MQLKGESLGERKKDLQTKVNQAVADNVQFDAIKDRPEETDVDRLFKIEVASKYRNVEYLLEVLKSGDSLYISKVLKCTWLYEDQYSDRINPDFLHLHIFPHMSTRMKRKFLTIISTYVKNENRCKDWYEYCTNIDLPVFAYKFLIFTSPQFKRDLLENKFENIQFDSDGPRDIKHFMKRDVTLAECYLKKLSERGGQMMSVLCNLSYFYSIEDKLYLNWLEKFWPAQAGYRSNNYVLGSNKTKSILKHHKNRVLRNIKLYLSVLHKKVLAKNTSIDEAKLYLIAKLPENADEFWSTNYLSRVEWLLNLIPPGEKFEFARKIFVDHYPGKEFELSSQFYRLFYFKYMTKEQKESWALRQIANPNKNILSDSDEDLDFTWYRFINFDKALVEIKKYVQITTDYHRRARIVEVLIESAQNQRDLEKLFNYYYERHVNEKESVKNLFVKRVLNYHNVTQFDERCWEAFNKLLYSIDVYDKENESIYTLYMFVAPVLVYHVLHNLDLPDAVEQFLWKAKPYLMRVLPDNLNGEQKETVYQYLLKSRVDKITEYDGKEYNKETQKELRKLIEFIKHLNDIFGKPKDINIDIVRKYMKMDPEFNEPEKSESLDQELLIKLLKQDSKLVLNKLPTLKKTLENRQVKLNTFLKLLQIYFSNDLKQEYLKFYLQLLTEEQSKYVLSSAVFGVFKLADEKLKEELMVKYAPSDVKVDHVKIDRRLLCIQEAICRFASDSRPSMPLSSMLLYIKGDYIKYCVPMFNRYLMKVPMSECIQLIEALLNSPVSIQKHGLRLAFKCFNAEDLKRLIDHVWKKTKNISLRMIIYKNIFELVLNKDAASQEEFFEILLGLTLTLHQDDHPEIFEFVTTSAHIYKLPEKLRGRYLESSWKVVNGFQKNKKNMSRQHSVIHKIEDYIEAMDKSFVKEILEEYFKDRLLNKTADETKDETEKELIDEKFKLALTFIVRSDFDGYFESGLDLVQLVIGKCLEKWNDTYKNDDYSETYYSREYLYDFIDGILNKEFCADNKIICGSNRIFNYILEKLQNTLPLHELYTLVWKIRMAVIANDVLNEIYLKERSLSETDFSIIVFKLTSRVIDLFKEFIERKEFHLSFLFEIGTVIQDNIQKLRLESNLKMDNVQLSDVIVFVSKDLVESGVTECILLAITILPCSFSDYSRKEHGSLLKTMNAMENYEIQALLYQKFIKSKFRAVKLPTSV